MTSLVWSMRAKSLNLKVSFSNLFRLYDRNHHFRFTGVFSRTALVTVVPFLAIPATIYSGTTPHKFPLSSVELIAGSVTLGISWIIAAIFYLIDR